MDILFISLVMAIFLNIFLGLFSFLQNKSDYINRLFLILTIFVSFWIVTNLAVDFVSSELGAFLIAQAGYLAALGISYYFFYFSYFFPNSVNPPWASFIFKIKNKALIVATVVSSLPRITIRSIVIDPWEIETGWGIYIFAFFFVVAMFSTFLLLLHKYKSSQSFTEKAQIRYVLMGTFGATILGVVFNLILPVVFNNYSFVRIGPVFTVILIYFISIAILRLHLFNIKVIATELLTFILWIFILIRTLIATNLQDRIANGVLLLVSVIIGILLIRSVLKEVHQREEIEALAGRLKGVNRILSHSVKGVLGKNKDMFISLLDGTFGTIADTAKPFLELSFKDTKKVRDIVVNILAAGQEMRLSVEKFNLKDAVQEVLADASADIEVKNLHVNTNIPEDNYTITADKSQLMAQVLKNLIENAINYTLEGGMVTVGLVRKDKNTIVFKVKDTGVGIKDEDKPNIFKEGGMGKDSRKLNVHSSGYGLFAAKKVTEAHGGKIWFESEGVAGKGSIFYVELPVA